MVQVLMAVSVAELVVLFVLPTLFVILYRVRSGGAWHDLAEGRHLMRFTAALSVTFFLTLANTLAAVMWPAWPTYVVDLFGCPVSLTVVALVVQVVVFAVLIIEMGNRLRLLLRGNGRPPPGREG